MLRLLHYSDVHLTVPELGWRPRDVVSKKVLGWVNVRLLGRGHRFKHAAGVAAEMIAEAERRGHDGILFSGDATKLAFEPEFAFAAETLRVGSGSLPPMIAVPGNHDYYTRSDIDRGHFERHFGPCLLGERIGDHPYPFARKIGHAWIVAVCSSFPSTMNLTASGGIGTEQLERLKLLCDRLDDGPRILLTHYPLRDSRGRVERRSHRLRDHRAALETARACGIRLWLHGHIHKPFVLPPSRDIPFPIICAGSATQTNKWAHNEYVLDGTDLTMARRIWNPVERRFDSADTASMKL